MARKVTEAMLYTQLTYFHRLLDWRGLVGRTSKAEDRLMIQQKLNPMKHIIEPVSFALAGMCWVFGRAPQPADELHSGFLNGRRLS
eukprot:scaffold3791_cov390-Prasinococcus_capsulatus_cf.AAC.11